MPPGRGRGGGKGHGAEPPEPLRSRRYRAGRPAGPSFTVIGRPGARSPPAFTRGAGPAGAVGQRRGGCLRRCRPWGLGELDAASPRGAANASLVRAARRFSCGLSSAPRGAQGSRRNRAAKGAPAEPSRAAPAEGDSGLLDSGYGGTNQNPTPLQPVPASVEQDLGVGFFGGGIVLSKV